MTSGEQSTVPFHHTRSVRVAFDAGPLYSIRTGIGEAVAQMQQSLSERDDVELRPYACSFRGDLPEGVLRLPLPASVAHQAWSRSQRPRMDRWLDAVDVVHGTNYVVPPSRKPRLVSVYDCWFLRHPEQAADAVVRAGRTLTAAVNAGATVHVTSRATACAARELLQTERVEVIPLAALPSAAHLGLLPRPPRSVEHLVGAPFIVAIGTLERRKNLTTLIAAFAELALPELHLVLAGSDGDDRPAIDDTIATLPEELRRRVVLCGRVEPEEKAWLLDQALVLGYPSLDEGFGFPLLEAMQHRLPVVGSTAGSIPEVAGKAALLVAPDDVAGMARALCSAITDSTARAALIAAGDTQLGHYSWDETARRLASLYHRLKDDA